MGASIIPYADMEADYMGYRWGITIASVSKSKAAKLVDTSTHDTTHGSLTFHRTTD